jgi:transcriptional regulator MraZ
MRGGANALPFTGTFEHAIDAKQRLAIPAQVRDELQHDHQERFLYAVLCEGPTLCLYTDAGFDKLSTQLDQSELPAGEVLEYEKAMYPLARKLDIDKQGRIRLPEQLLSVVNLPRDVVLIGVKDHLEIHGRDQWHQHMQQILTTRQDLLANPRRMIGTRRRNPPPDGD